MSITIALTRLCTSHLHELLKTNISINKILSAFLGILGFTTVQVSGLLPLECFKLNAIQELGARGYTKRMLRLYLIVYKQVRNLTSQCLSTYKPRDFCGTYPSALGAGGIGE